MARPRGLLRLREMPAGEVAAADVQHLALLHELLHRLPDLLPGALPIDVMHLIQIEMVGAQAPQTALARFTDMPRREPRLIRPIAHAAVHLRRKHDFLAAAAALREPAADDLFGYAFANLPAIDVRGVEEIEAVLERAVHDLPAVRFACLWAEVHGAEAEAADLQSGAAEMHGVHDAMLLARALQRQAARDNLSPPAIIPRPWPPRIPRRPIRSASQRPSATGCRPVPRSSTSRRSRAMPRTGAISGSISKAAVPSF